VGAWQPSTARDQIAQLNVDYGNFDREVKMIPSPTPQFIRGWNDVLNKWMAFYVDNQSYLAITPLNVNSKIRDVGMYRQTLEGWRTAFIQETGKKPQTPGPVAPPPPEGKKPEEPAVPSWLVSVFAILGVGGVAYAAYSGLKRKDSASRRR